MSLLSDVRNFLKVDDRVLTAGQPNEAQLADAAQQGVKAVINLALHDDPRYSLADEAGCVRGLGMDYIHIPVQFSAPTEEDLHSFMSAMDAHKDDKVLVHCAANYRVTAFIGLYRVLREQRSVEEAFQPMRAVWEPNQVWLEFIEKMLQRAGVYPPLEINENRCVP
jgi:uncharacterized protein (TIGR01244 family)